jgi:hypothetical protein
MTACERASVWPVYSILCAMCLLSAFGVCACNTSQQTGPPAGLQMCLDTSFSLVHVSSLHSLAALHALLWAAIVCLCPGVRYCARRQWWLRCACQAAWLLGQLAEERLAGALCLCSRLDGVTPAPRSIRRRRSAARAMTCRQLQIVSCELQRAIGSARRRGLGAGAPATPSTARVAPGTHAISRYAAGRDLIWAALTPAVLCGSPRPLYPWPPAALHPRDLACNAAHLFTRCSARSGPRQG